jgi:hypothetical protein
MKENIFNRRCMIVTEVFIEDDDLRIKNIVFENIMNGRNYINRWCDCAMPKFIFGDSMVHECGQTTLVWEEVEYFDAEDEKLDFEGWNTDELVCSCCHKGKDGVECGCCPCALHRDRAYGGDGR